MHAIVAALLLLCCSESTLGTDYREEYFEQKIDHFNFLSYGSRTYKQRYLYNDSWWEPTRGPIFFYAGNEGAIDGFWENSGFIMEIAPKFKALVVFAEHRFYGKSLPFGNDSFDDLKVGLLSIEQAMADYAFFVKAFKEKFRAGNCPVIAFGGSYGGMLAAYMRFKYPNIVQGAIAASAPIYLVAGLVPGSEFFQAVSRVFEDANPQCEPQVRAAFAQMDKWAASGDEGLKMISKALRLCKPLKSAAEYDLLLRWARNAFVMAAMMNYPYPTEFMSNFPAFPVHVMCDRLVQKSANPVVNLGSACGLVYNGSGDVACYDIFKEYIYCADPTGCGLGFDSMAWDYQACTEINLEGSTDGQSDIFPDLPFNASMRDAYCNKAWHVIPRRNWLETIEWGKDILSSSNIVFSNGDLDPWSVGGVLQNLTDTLVAVVVEGGAHHLDLRSSNPNDPPSVKTARDFEVRNIQNWLEQYYNQSL